MAGAERSNGIQVQDLPELVELDEREHKAIVGGSGAGTIQEIEMLLQVTKTVIVTVVEATV
jgi:hypothetical protein